MASKSQNKPRATGQGAASTMVEATGSSANADNDSNGISATETDFVDSEDRTEPFNVGPDRTPGLISAWDGIYHVFGGRVGRWEVTPDGLIAVGFTVNQKYDPNQILTDINARPHKPRLFGEGRSGPIEWIFGIEPEFFPTDQDMTTWLVQSFKGSVPDGVNRSPKYARDAMADLKIVTGRKRKQGPRKSTINFKNLNELTVEALKNADPAGLAHLQEVLKQVQVINHTEQPVTA